MMALPRKPQTSGRGAPENALPRVSAPPQSAGSCGCRFVYVTYMYVHYSGHPDDGTAAQPADAADAALLRTPCPV